MKISEYIQHLAKIMAEHGDLPCYNVEGDNDEWIESRGPEVREPEGPKHTSWHLPKRVNL